MNRIEVKVCACAECVMNGAMDIVDTVESLQSLKSLLRLNSKVTVIANERLCPRGDVSGSPRVMINGEVFEKVDSETVAEKVISAMVAK